MVMQNTNLNIRISQKIKDRFIEVAKKNGLTYSVAVRELMKKYIRENGKTLETY